jgi:hypothetical protein
VESLTRPVSVLDLDLDLNLDIEGDTNPVHGNYTTLEDETARRVELWINN